MNLTTLVTDARKFLVVLAAVIAQAIELGLLHGSALHYATVASTVVAAVLVYVVPNGATSSGQALPLEQPQLPKHNYPTAQPVESGPPAVTPADPQQPAAGVPPAVTPEPPTPPAAV